ncbi:MAG: small ribosomal subunit Rsm22 family protein [Chlamydiota bacterium]
MSILEEKKIVIRLPRFEWRAFLSLRFVLGFSLIFCLGAFAYWYHAIRPFLWTQVAYVDTFSLNVSSDIPGRILEMGPQEGDLVKKGEILFALDRDLIFAKARQAQGLVEALKEQIRLEKTRMEKAMQDYLSGEQEGGGEVQKHLAILEEAQVKSERMTAQLTLAQTDLSLFDLQLKKMIFPAPFDGVILKRSANPGAVAAFGDPIYVLSDPSRTWIEAEIPETAVGSVHIGSPAAVRVAAFPNREWKGHVSWISPSAYSRNAKRCETIAIKISLEGLDIPSLERAFSVIISSMQLPFELQTAIESLLENAPSPALRKGSEELSSVYREGHGSGSIFSSENRRLAYLAARMPATYAAVHHVLQKANLSPESILDLGAGPGTAFWAAADLFPKLKQIIAIEKSPEAIALGKLLTRNASHPALQTVDWIQQSLGDQVLPFKADLGILSYVIGELKDSDDFIKRCWQALPALAIIEPGTPKGFSLIRKIRKQLIEMGAHILAPCPHSLACPIQGSDWCHFSERVERTRLHRLLKEGSLGYEDEKFSYLIAAKFPDAPPKARIVRTPAKQSGHVRLALCTEAGRLETVTVTRKEKERYRLARDAEWGDPWV